MPLFPRPLVVLDTETTGFPEAPWSRVLELAAVLLSPDGEVLDTFESFVRPEIHDDRGAGAERVHGITAAMVAEAPLAGPVADAFRAWGRAKGAAAVTSFNADFDRPMVERMGLDRLPWAGCVMLRAMEVMGPAGALRNADPSHPRYVPGRPWLWPSLALAASFFRVPVEGDAHRALTDARTAAGVALAIAHRAASAAASGESPA